MGLFKKKADPISERARALNDQIAELESQIAQLADKLESEPEEPPPPPPPQEKVARSASRAEASERKQVPAEPPLPREPQPGQPRLRSTAYPQRQVVVHTAAPEPVFEDVPNNPFKTNGDEPAPEPENDIGVRKGTFAEMWQRLQSQFRTPPAANPKLVSYLAAGSIQGLRPLRYEKRVARNRFIALVIILILVIWGLLAVFLRK